MWLLADSLLEGHSLTQLRLLSVFCSLRPGGEDRPSVAGQIHLAEVHDSLLHHDGPVQKGQAGTQTRGFVSAHHVTEPVFLNTVFLRFAIRSVYELNPSTC